MTIPPRLKAKLTADALLVINWALPGATIIEPKGKSEEELDSLAGALADEINALAATALPVLAERGFTKADLQERSENASATADALDEAAEEFRKGLLR